MGVFLDGGGKPSGEPQRAPAINGQGQQNFTVGGFGDREILEMAGTPVPGPDEPEDPIKPDPDKRPDPNLDKDEFGIPRELWPYRDQMMAWVDGAKGRMRSFLYHNGHPITIVPSDWFRFNMVTNVLQLSVPEYKKIVEQEGQRMSIEQFLFLGMHEFGHKKAKIEMSELEAENWLKQLDYESTKGYWARDPEGKKIRLSTGNFYHGFYNILEDPIVNGMVLATPYYSRTFSRERYEQIVELYSSRFFQLFTPVESGQGDYVKSDHVKSDDPKDKQDFKFVGAGNGSYRLLQREDYEKGFDWSRVETKMNKSGQFQVFFMKNQMAELDAREIYDPELNPDGKHHLDSDVAAVFSRPIVEVYDLFLRRFVERYGDDQQKMDDYLTMMAESIAVPVIKEVDGEIVESDKPEIYYNVLKPNALNTFNGKIVSYKQPIKHNIARHDFEFNLKDILSYLGINDLSRSKTITFLEIYRAFREFVPSKNDTAALRNRVDLLSRTKIIRRLLEPIFTLLCILDDSFKMKAPPEMPKPPDPDKKGDGKDGDGQRPETMKPPIWDVGDMVRHKKTGKFGRIVRILERGQDGTPVAVDVEYINEDLGLADGYTPAYDSEIIYNPNDYLEIVFEEGDGEDGDDKVKRAEDKRDKHIIKKKDQDKKKKKNKKKQQSQGEEGDPEENESGEGDGEDEKDQPDDKDGEDGSRKNPKEGEDNKSTEPKGMDKEDVDSAIDDEREFIEKILKDKQGKRKAKEAIDERSKPEYRKKAGQKARDRQVAQKLRENRHKSGEKDPALSAGREGKPRPDLADEEMIKKIHELEEMIVSSVNAISLAWEEAILNITEEIVRVKTLGYKGDYDIDEVIQNWGRIQGGEPTDWMRIFERYEEQRKQEIMPRMLRIVMLIDNSGSMADPIPDDRSGARKIDAMRFVIMLLNASLRDLRVKFRDNLSRAIGKSVDIFCDVELRTFGSRDQLIQPFVIDDFSFLEKSDGEYPEQSHDESTISTIRAFQHLTTDEGTRDSGCWGEILEAHDQTDIGSYLSRGLLSEIILQITDGAIPNSPPPELFELQERYPQIPIAGISIGSDSSAAASLALRHKHVIQANTIDEFVEQITKYLIDIVKTKFEQPIINNLKNFQNSEGR